MNVREALIAARLQHPSIVPVCDAGKRRDLSPFYAMKLVAGRPLDQAIAEATTVAQRLSLLPSVLAVADAMAYAHGERIIHRDLTPRNVLVGNFGETVVIGWGLAKDLAIDDHEALDAGPYRAAGADHTVAGAPAYLAPEQAVGETVDERTDVYALGAILYHVVSGTIPHQGPLEPEVPRELAAIVSKAMALDPSKRYPNARALADDLRRFQTGQLVASHSYGTRELVWRWIERHRAAVTAAVAALAVVGVVGTMSIARIVRARRAADHSADAARAAENRTGDMLADTLMEQGRQELLAARPARAAVYLSQAAQIREPGVALRSLLAAALPSIEPRMSLDGHDGGLTSAVFSSDGTRIATASEDRTVKLWDAATGTVIATLPADAQTALSLSRDGSRIATVGNGSLWAKLWDARTGTLVATLEHHNEVLSATFSPDSAQLITTTGGCSVIVKVWDAKTGELRTSFERIEPDVVPAELSADSARVITSGRDHSELWDMKTGTRLRRVGGDHAAHRPRWPSLAGITFVAYSPGGRSIATVADDTATLWGVSDGALPATELEGHVAEIHSASFSPDNTRVVTASRDHTAKLWDVATGRLLASFEGHRDDVTSAVFSPDGTKVVTASADGTAKLWDAMPSVRSVALDGADDVAMGTFSSDGAKLVTIGSDGNDRTAAVSDTRTGKRLASLEGHHDAITSATFDATAARVITASKDNSAKLWDANTGKLLVSFAHDAGVDRAELSPDGARVATISDGRARLWNAKLGTLIARLDRTELPHVLPVKDDARAVVFSEDGHHIVTANADGTARIWSAEDGTLIVQLDGHLAEVGSAELSRDGERVVTASKDRTAKIWDARTGKLLASLEGHTDAIDRATFSADGTRVLTSSRDHTVRLWDAHTGTLLVAFDRRATSVDARFGPDRAGARVWIVDGDRTAELRDARTGKLLAVLDVGARFSGARFSPDGTRIWLVDQTGTVWSWDVHLDARTPDAIQRIITDRDPWKLSDGGLVAVPPVLRGVTQVEDDKPSLVHEYETETATLLEQVVALFDQRDCDKVAANLRAFMVANEDQVHDLVRFGWIDRASLVKTVVPIMKRAETGSPAFQNCRHNKAVALALDMANLNIP